MNESDFVDICKVMEQKTNIIINVRIRGAFIPISIACFNETETEQLTYLFNGFTMHLSNNFPSQYTPIYIDAYPFIRSMPICWDRIGYILDAMRLVLILTEQNYILTYDNRKTPKSLIWKFIKWMCRRNNLLIV